MTVEGAKKLLLEELLLEELIVTILTQKNLLLRWTVSPTAALSGIAIFREGCWKGNSIVTGSLLCCVFLTFSPSGWKPTYGWTQPEQSMPWWLERKKKKKTHRRIVLILFPPGTAFDNDYNSQSSCEDWYGVNLERLSGFACTKSMPV